MSNRESSFRNPKTRHSFILFDGLQAVNAPRTARAPGDNSGIDIYDEINRLDEDKMMAHILDCVGALAEKQRVRVALEKPLTLTPNGAELTPEQQASRNKVFKAALGLLAEGLTHDGDAGAGGYAFDFGWSALELASAFPDSAKRTDGRGWLPLHWAIVAAVSAAAGWDPYGVTEADVKAVYALDPLALCRHHLEKDVGRPFQEGLLGFTPSHLLCMGPTMEQTMALVRMFSAVSPESFTMNVRSRPYAPVPECVFGALHVACKFGQPTEWLLQQLLQLDSSACGRHPCFSGSSPLGALCESSPEWVDERLVQCLLAADSSAEVVYDGIESCLASKMLVNRVEAVKLLLGANPRAAQEVADPAGLTLAWNACFHSSSVSADECIEILAMLLKAHRDAFKIAANPALGGLYPMHWLARWGRVEALEYLLDACPEVPATTVSIRSLLTALHFIVNEQPSDDQVAKIRLLCSRHPAMMLQRDCHGWMPLHSACNSSYTADVVLALCEAGGREVASAPVVQPGVIDDEWPTVDGWLPLHFFLRFRCDNKAASLLSLWADAFRLLLRLYPEAAGIEAGEGEYKKTPYQQTVDHDLPAYYRRLLLRAAPHLDPAELRHMNWEERRTAMYVAYAATFPKGTKPALLARFRLENPDMVKHVVSFL